MNRFVVISFLVFAQVVARAQGLVFNDDAYKQAPQQLVDSGGAKGEDEVLRNTFKVDLKPYCPTPRSQGKISSCVGWSVGYGAMTIEKAIASKWGNHQKKIDENAFSAMYLFNQIKLGSCDFGAELNNAFGFLKEHGNVLYQDFLVGYDCDSLPLAKLSQKAKLNRVRDFVTLFNPDEKPDVKINRVKLALAHQKPVVIGMVVLDNFLALRSGDHTWYPNVGKTDLFGGHAMVVVGYDDGRKAFEIMNSWGTAWANNGFVWIRYEDFAHYCKYAYQLSLTDQQTNYLEGSVQVLKPVVKTINVDERNVVFSPLTFDFRNDRYVLKKEYASLPLEFQVTAQGLRTGSYLYVVGFDEQMQYAIYWPRNEELSRHFTGEYESGEVTSTQYKIVLPGKYVLFSMTKPATEYICLINSQDPVKDIAKKLAQVAVIKGELSDRLQKVFGNRIVKDYVKDLQQDRISFFASGNRNFMMAILLEFDIKK